MESEFNIKEMFNLKGKRALITGGSGGIGFACARGLAEFGAQIALVDVDREALAEKEEILKASGHHAFSVQTDISEYGQVERMIDKVTDTFGGIDILINSAAVTNRKSLMQLSPEEWNRIIQVNLTGAYYISKRVGPVMLKQKKGKLIFIVSTGAMRAGVNFSAYGASKAGVVMLMRTIALEWAPYVNVNAIAPTATDTQFTRDYYRTNPERKEAVMKNHPFGRIALPEDYIGAAVYLASAASDFVNGEVLVVDSGKIIK